MTSLEVTLGMEALDGSFNDSFTRTIFIDDTTVVTDVIDPVTGMVTGTDSNREVGANTTTFDMLAFGVTTGAFGGTVGPTPGSSTVGEANNGIDISNVTITYFDADGVAMTALKGDADLDGDVDFADIPAFIAILQGGMFLAQADCDCDLDVDFADIPAFIAILQGG